MKALVLVALAACADPIDMTPVIDGPVNDPDADVFGQLDQIELTAAHAGSAGDLVAQSFPGSGTLGLADVPLADDLVIHMTGRVGGDDVAYGRTCAFAAANDASPHLFFSRSQKFAGLGVSPEIRSGGTGFTYHDGSGLLIGGTAGSGSGAPAVVDVERFDPHTGEQSTVAQLAARTGAAVSSVGTGEFEVIVLGGIDATTMEQAGYLELIEVDAPARVTRIDDARIQRSGMTATALTDGRVRAGGARLAPSTLSPDVDAIAFDSTGTLQIQLLRGALSVPREKQTATRLGDDVGAEVLIAGGLDVMGNPVAVGELFKPLDGEFADPATFSPMMVVPRSGHAAVRLPDGSVLILGGVDASGMPVTTVERFSVDGGFVALPADTLPPGAPTVDFATATLPDGRVLILGSKVGPGSPAQTVAFIASLDTTDDTVNIVPTDSLDTARDNPQAVLLCDGTVLVSGGTDASVPAERYNPPATDRR